MAGTQVRSAGRGPPVGDHALRDTGGFVGFLADGEAVHQVFRADLAGHFGDDRGGVGVPIGQTLATLHLVAVLDLQTRAVRRLVVFAFLAVDQDAHGRVAAHDDQEAVGADNGGAGHADRTVVAAFEERLLGHLGGAADVEGPHRQLGAGLADGLGGDDADRFTDVDRRTASQVAAVAGAADADLGFAGQDRTDLHRLHGGRFDGVGHVLGQVGVGRERPVRRSPGP
jgi:hypothetical protein